MNVSVPRQKFGLRESGRCAMVEGSVDLAEWVRCTFWKFWRRDRDHIHALHCVFTFGRSTEPGCIVFARNAYSSRSSYRLTF